MEGEAVLPLLIEEVQHGLIHVAGAQTAPEGYHDGLPVVKGQLPPGLLRRFLEEVPPHRCTRHHDALRMPVVLAAVLKAHHDDVCVLLQHPGGQPRHGVALVYRRGDVGLRCGLHHGIAGVAAGAHHQIGSELLQDGLGRRAGAGQHPHGVEVVAHGLRAHGAAEAVHLHGGVGRQIPLHAVGCAHEQHGGLGVALPHQPCQRQRRIHMSRGAPAGEDHSHRKLRFLYVFKGSSHGLVVFSVFPRLVDL